MAVHRARRLTSDLLQPGENCCEVAQAERIALLVDGEEYFDAFAQAAEAARHSIFILAWDFDSRTRLYRSTTPPQSRFARLRRRVRSRLQRGSPADECATLGDFLNTLTRRSRSLHVHVLIWDYPMIFGLDREFPPLYGLGWKPGRRVHVSYDNTHPVGASHHQKIVVIDDRVAFCGGIDLTARRWDTCHHRLDEPRRHSGEAPYPPFHDTMMLVNGEAARALGALARARWQRATGGAPRPPRAARRLRGGPSTDPWPSGVKPALENWPVAISRTVPGGDSEPAVREIEQLYLDMIGRAERGIYIENQYFTSQRIGAALAERLAEADGPEIIVILRLLSHGWLETLSMEALRTRLLLELKQADRGGRFHFYYPHVGGLPAESCIDVHAKLMVVDDEILRIGSANLAGRSMGLDTECDLTFTAGGDEQVSAVIARFRTRLLAEHLGVEPEVFLRAHARHGSLGAAIEALRREVAQLPAGARTLAQFRELKEAPEALAGVIELVDAEKPVSFKRLLPQFAPTEGAERRRPAWGVLAAIFGALLLLAAAWRWTPLAQVASAEQINLWVARFADTPWAPFAVLAAYTPASVIMFPRPLITLFAVLAFGPWLGFACAMGGNLIAGWASYLAGGMTRPETLRRLAGPNFGRISAVLRQRGVLAVTAVRLVPLAPYAVPGMVAGAARVRPWHFLAGTFLGLLPGVLTTTVFGDALSAALQDSGQINYWLVGGVLALLAWGTWRVRRWLLTTRIEDERKSD